MIARGRAGMGKVGDWQAEHKMRWLDHKVDFASELAIEGEYVADGVEEEIGVESYFCFWAFVSLVPPSCVSRTAFFSFLLFMCLADSSLFAGI